MPRQSRTGIVIFFFALFTVSEITWGAPPKPTASVEWTRLRGSVKSINLRDRTVTIQNRDGDLITVPVDYQVKIYGKGTEDVKDLAKLSLDDKVVLTRVQADAQTDESFQDMNKQPDAATAR